LPARHQHRYQQTTVTFDCRFTAPTSTGCPHRLDEHEHHAAAA